ncbi:MAG: toxin, RelE family protein [Nitrospirales bacterium]|nr:MAG: toxin, RelE family protein [Nitrospirales bacterium]
MAFNLIVRPEAERDLSEAFRWYEGQRKGLGHDFLLQIDAGFRFLERTPLVFPEMYRRIRRHLIKRFPYKIYYTVEQNTVVILAIVYGGRNPQWLRNRLDPT